MAQGFPQNWPTATPSATSVPTLLQLQNFLIPPQIQDGAQVWCIQNQQFYLYQSQSGAVVDGTTVLSTRNGALSRWILYAPSGGGPTLNPWLTITASQNLAISTNYFVDTTGGRIVVSPPSILAGLIAGTTYFELKDSTLNFGTNNLIINTQALILESPQGGFTNQVILATNGDDILYRWNGTKWNLTS
jgi:hypothetical protein